MPAAGLPHRLHLGHPQHRAGPDRRIAAEGARHRRDRGERIGRVHRHFDRGDAGADQRARHRQRFGRGDPAQDGDQVAGHP
jgi:hypothetical protein